MDPPDQFLALMPCILRCLSFSFRHLRDDARDDAIQEGVANAFVAFLRLAASGRTHRAYPTQLARYAIIQFRSGRRVGSKTSVRDVLSPLNQKKGRCTLEVFRESVMEDYHTPVPEQVCFRVDFPGWLHTLRSRDRKVAEHLATGHTTSEVAKRFSLSEGRISQMRRELHASWQQFQSF